MPVPWEELAVDISPTSILPACVTNKTIKQERALIRSELTTASGACDAGEAGLRAFHICLSTQQFVACSIGVVLTVAAASPQLTIGTVFNVEALRLSQNRTRNKACNVFISPLSEHHICSKCIRQEINARQRVKRKQQQAAEDEENIRLNQEDDMEISQIVGLIACNLLENEELEGTPQTQSPLEDLLRHSYKLIGQLEQPTM